MPTHGVLFDLGIQFQSSNWKFNDTTTYNSWTINEAKFNQIRDAVDGNQASLKATKSPKFNWG